MFKMTIYAVKTTIFIFSFYASSNQLIRVISEVIDDGVGIDYYYYD